MCSMPYIVTFDGSPPNAAIYFRIHRSASRSTTRSSQWSNAEEIRSAHDPEDQDSQLRLL